MIPVGDRLRAHGTPYVNWTLIAVNLAVFIYTITLSTRPDQLLGGFRTSEIDRFFYDWGFVSSCIGEFFGLDPDVNPRILNAICPPGDREAIQPLTAMFLHAGWAHILGNMLFLWIFGDNVEGAMGHGRYLVFYLACGLVAAAAQTAVTLDATVPAIGASGAIAGVLGAYLIMFPRALVQVVIIPFFFLPFFVPAVVLIGVWVITQVFSGIAEMGRETVGEGVAWWAHVGGFTAGAVLITFFRRQDRGHGSPREQPG